MKKIILTQKKYDEMLKELEYLKTTRRRELSKEIGIAREKGDISENAEYDAAKDAQGMLEKRISEMEEKLSRATVMENVDIASDKAYIGATVKVKDLDSGDESSYILTAEEEADFKEGKISVDSPIGKALLGHKVGDSIKIQIPAGILDYKILKITRE
ncbi:MAG: transcription elongation factor GreA [Candidatus Omnitrophica bacterium CG12_big_fil_rev_8_21_14_0_65_43_15]|uniref:Transcription elongation factor GreA n=1 Tax=Candidatus Taenaricola geysiri TaxID=1974752 RepID=A0A2J0LFF0_9BACT|nr:MAG: transcription elongation factor GreA [Candidatus Omnitrophica bacterium CG1_02_43_210]PIV12198.1 MAG: transcription elongation factor GreA [Candidatus Omnitrophica bacterium CG03_land_8_20_14_0_80_43_22]PIW66575.1 MAG: transcription elongation factor GreA [Candidatus Omnitrophica bacterium CG12_big_fil_rev_8_21_14_0_65_43_15]PIW80547.1 MAG: transcription elongation factor GreA [Candidatus Omnitrophica bacterium CG_4_8_14_3_um_filter_43_15]PIY84532.1 MAG: transcription elongation factor 